MVLGSCISILIFTVLTKLFTLVAIREVSAKFSMLNHQNYLTMIQWRSCLAQHNHPLEDSLLPLPYGRIEFSNLPEDAPSAARGDLNTQKLPELGQPPLKS